MESVVDSDEDDEEEDGDEEVIFSLLENLHSNHNFIYVSIF